MKRKIIVSFVILLSLFLITGCGKKKEEIKQEENNNQEQANNQEETKKPNDSIVETQIVGDFKFEIKKMEYNDGDSILEYSINLESEESKALNSYIIRIYNGEKEITSIEKNNGNNNIIQNDKKRILTQKLENFDITTATAIVFEINDNNE